MQKGLWKKGLVLGIIILFVGIAVQPGIIADDSFESVNSELVEITIQICNGNGANDITVMLTEEQVKELESIISSTKTKLDAAKTMEETSAIFNDAAVSLYELGVLPEGMSIEDAQRLVNGIGKNPWIVKILERWFSRNQEEKETVENFLCLIAGHTDETWFVGPSFILKLIIWGPLLPLIILLNILFGTEIPDIDELFQLFFDRGLISLIWQYNPLAFGHTILLGYYSTDYWPPGWVHAEGWIYTIGLKGIKSWNSFGGSVLGFTGIKICYPPIEDRTHFYMGAALRVKIGEEPL